MLFRSGIMALLRRKLRKILAFVNTETQLTMSGNEVVVDSDLPPLFGLEWSDSQSTYVPISSNSPFRFNQVFDRATFDDLRQQLWSRAQAGATSAPPAYARLTTGTPSMKPPSASLQRSRWRERSADGLLLWRRTREKSAANLLSMNDRVVESSAWPPPSRSCCN